MMNIFLSLMTVLGLCSASALAMPPADELIIDVDQPETVVGTRFEYFADDSGKLTIDDVASEQSSGKFKRADETNLVPTYTMATHWVKLRIKTASPDTRWHIQAEYTSVAEFGVYQAALNEPGTFQWATDDEIRVPTAPVRLDGAEVTTVYLKIKPIDLIDLQLTVRSLDALDRKERADLKFIWLCIGCFLTMIVYNIFLLITLHDKDYAYYLFFAITNCHSNLVSIGVPLNIYNWFDVPLQTYWVHYRPVFLLSMVLFARSFLQTKINFRVIDLILKIFVGVMIIMTIAPFVASDPVCNDILDQAFLAGLLFLLFVGGWGVFKGHKGSLYFLIATGILIVSGVIFVLGLQGVLPLSPFTLFATLWGQALEMVFMSLALGWKVKVLREDKMAATWKAELNSSLLRAVSHDIAAPLNVAANYADMIVPDGGNRQLQMIRWSLNEMRNVLKFSSITRAADSKLKLTASPVSLEEVFGDLALLFEAQAQEKNIRLRFDLADKSLRVLAEKVCLTNEVMANFLSNAIKFSQPGGEVFVGATAQGDHVIITVKDQGVGMEMALAGSLFERKRNKSRPGTQGELGSGYGMAIASFFIKAFNGKVTVESSPASDGTNGSGTVFRMTLPRAFED